MGLWSIVVGRSQSPGDAGDVGGFRAEATSA